MEYLGYKIEYSKFQKRWFVMEFDWGLGWHDVMSKPTKSAAMKWIEENQGIFI